MAESQHLGSQHLKFQHLETVLPELDCMGDPQGGAVAWALLVMTATLIAGILLAAL